MNKKNKIIVAALACIALCGTAAAAPGRNERHGGNGHGASAPTQQHKTKIRQAERHNGGTERVGNERGGREQGRSNYGRTEYGRNEYGRNEYVRTEYGRNDRDTQNWWAFNPPPPRPPKPAPQPSPPPPPPRRF